MAKTPKFNAKTSGLPQHFFSKWIPETRPVRTKPCDHPGCEGVGEYRAPARHYREEQKVGPLNVIDEKREQVNRWFCLEHVKQYNAAWDYYEGLDQTEMEQAIRFDAVWNRPTWTFGQWGPQRASREEAAKAKAYRRHVDDDLKDEPEDANEASAALMMEAGRAALSELGLAPPVDFGQVKKRYRELVKRHHPDMKAQDDTDGAAQESDTIRRLNAAFTLLKSFYARRKSA